MNITQTTPVDYQTVNQKIKESGLESVGNASIREIVKLVNEIEKATGEKYIRMEMGVPGLEPPDMMMEGELNALKRGVASKYPMIEGVQELKTEISKFIKNFRF